MRSKEWLAWQKAARNRYPIKLMDGREAELVGVRKATRSVKVRMGFRHYICWVEDVALVKIDGTWTLLPPWQVAPLPPENAPQPRSSQAHPSQNWLTVKPDPRALHPSFASSPSRPSTSPSPTPASTDSGSE